MECNVVQDLIPLYMDGCCSEESKKIVKEHIDCCDSCRKLLEDMRAPSDMVSVSKAPTKMHKINDWKASVMQSVLLFLSFAIITIGVALEARTPSGLINSFWAINLIIPATGFMLSLANWYFIKLYQNRKSFSNYSLIVTLGITICAYIWAEFHYATNPLKLLLESNFTGFFDVARGMGILLTVVFCILSKNLSNQYAKMLGKE